MKTMVNTGIFLCTLMFFSILSFGQKYGDYRDNIIDTIVTEDGRVAYCIKVPGKPPDHFYAPPAVYTRSTKTLPLVPAFNWSFGCSATSAAMIAGYYDNFGYPNMYLGPTNNGVMPMDNSSWPDTTINGELRHQCPLSATCQGLDGRTIPGHVDDYWISYQSPGPDPWTIAGGGSGIQHAYGDCTGDYMKTNQWLDPGEQVNIDGSTAFWSWENGTKFNLDDAEYLEVEDLDGMYGFALFMASRGYTVTGAYTQLTKAPGLSHWMSFADFKAEIDAGRPVLIHITGHTMVGFGYDDTGGDSTIYIHDTWNFQDHTMKWDGTYDNKTQWAATVLHLAPSTYNVWDGSLSNDWGAASNWSLGHVPTATEDVIIPNLNTPVIINGSNKVCNNLFLYPGTTLRIYNYQLEVNGDFTCFGLVDFFHEDAILRVHGNMNWEDSSSVTITSSNDYKPVIYAYSDWRVRDGSNIDLIKGIVDFQAGTGNSWIWIQSPLARFHHIRNYKTGGNSLGLASSSTDDLIIEGNLYNYSGSDFVSSSGQTIQIEGFFNNMGGNIHLALGTLEFSGNPSQIAFKPNAGNYVKNLTVNSGAYSLVLDNTYSNQLEINGDLNIVSGFLSANNFTIRVGGNWYNLAGKSHFLEATSRVMFDGITNQYIYNSEDFYILEANSGGTVRVWEEGDTVTCDIYDWTDGGIHVNYGAFIAADLADPGLFGIFNVAAGFIDLYQDAAQYVDLNGALTISSGGVLNVHGGSDNSYWTYDADASLFMSGGVLEFFDHGIHITSDNNFTDNITGGIIASAGDFVVNRTDFNPTGGTIEFAGTADCYASHLAGSNFFNILVDKTNTVRLATNLDVNGSVTISAGILDVNASNYTLSVAGNWTNNGTSANFSERTGAVLFDGITGGSLMTGETFYNLSLNRVLSGYNDLVLASGVNVSVTNDLNIIAGTLEMDLNAALDIGNDLIIASGGGLNANDGGNNIYCAGDFTDDNAAYSSYVGFNPGTTSAFTFDGTTLQYLHSGAPQQEFHRLNINKTNNFRSYDNIKVTGDLTIYAGNWQDALSDLTHTFQGDFTVSSGAGFYGNTGNTVYFTGPDNQDITFDPAECFGAFNNVIIDKSITRDPGPVHEDEELPGEPEQDRDRSYAIMMVTDLEALSDGNVTVNSGTVYFYGQSLKATGDVKVYSGATLKLDSDAALEIGGTDSLIVFSGGILETIGTAGHEARIGGYVNGNYAFEVQSGGTIRAKYTVFEQMGPYGVYVKSGALVDAVNQFDYCTFQDGYAGTATLLRIDNDEILNIDNAVFPTSTTTKNVTKTVNTGTIVFTGATGVFAGPVYEDDGNGRINWTEHGMWDGSVSSDWNTAGNWGFDLVPTSLVDVVVPAGCPNYPVLTNNLGVNSAAFTYDSKSLTINAGGRVTISGEYDLNNYGTITTSGDLIIGDDYNGYSNSVLNIAADTVRVGDASLNSIFMITNTAIVNQSGGHLLAEIYNFINGCQYNGNGGTMHMSALGTVPASQYITISDPDSYFGNITIDAGVNALMSATAYDLECRNVFDIYGSFNVNGEDLLTDFLDVHGTLKINTGNIDVMTNGPFFYTGSTFIMGGGALDGGSVICFYTGVNDLVTGGLITVKEDLINYSETFAPSGGIFEFTGTLPSQIINKTDFHDLRISKQGTFLENGSDGAGVNFLCNNLIINSGTLELNLPCTLTVDYVVDIESGAFLNADDGAVIIEVGDDWVNKNNNTVSFIPGTSSIVKFNADVAGTNQVVKERATFRNLVIEMTGLYVTPDPVYQSIHAYNLDINTGTLNIASYRVDVDYNMSISGNLMMTDASDTLNVGNDMTWKAGSSDNVTAGIITIDNTLIFNDGTTAQLGTGNTVVFNDPGTSFIYCKDADATIGNIDICKVPSASSDTYIHGSSTFPVNITGNLTIRNGNQFHIQTRDLLVQGWLTDETGAEIDLMSGGELINNHGFIHGGSLTVGGGNVILHGLFEPSAESVLNLAIGNLVCDAPYVSGTTVEMDGTLNMSGGTLEISNNSVSFTSTFNCNIFGGTIKTGASFSAINDVFRPSGGKVELTGTNPAGIGLDDDSYFFDLVYNKPGVTTPATSGFSVKHDLKVSAGMFNTNGMGINVGP